MGEKSLREFFDSLDRSLFIDNAYSTYAHIDTPLPIGFEQTISQPSLVYYMTKALQLEKSHKVLEIGTGSGYQTALLAQFANTVYTVELIEELSLKAQQRLKNFGFSNINYKIGDGSLGWGENSPYDRIMVTAAPKRIPNTVVDQLCKGGIMILPVGPFGNQKLIKLSKDQEGAIKTEDLFAVSFVEMKGKYSLEQ
ncbi:MAG: protein-L-isoaspartate(D-aspartate) O-methyltransferase [Sphaerochaetaceae bacterium]